MNDENENDSTNTSNIGSVEVSNPETGGTSSEHTGNCDSTEISGSVTADIDDDCDSAEVGNYGSTDIGDHGITEDDIHSGTEISMEAIDHSRTELDDHENDQHVNVHNVNNSHKKLLSPGTPVQKSITSTRRSPLTKLLIYPTPTQKISNVDKC